MREITTNNTEIDNGSAPESQETLALRMKATESKILDSISQKTSHRYQHGVLSDLIDDKKIALSLVKGLHGLGLNQEEKIILLGGIANIYRPEQGYVGGPIKKPKLPGIDLTEGSSKEESIDDEIWRVAVNKLRKLSKLPKLSESVYDQSNKNTHIGSYANRVKNADLAESLLEQLQGNNSPEDLIANSLIETETFLDLSTIDVLEEQLDFEVFPPEKNASILKGLIEKETPPEFLDKERLDFFLKIFADNLRKGNDIRVFFSKVNLKALTGYDEVNSFGSLARFRHYFILVITTDLNRGNVSEAGSEESLLSAENQPGKRVVAFADNFVQGNAMFVHRSDVDIAGTWRETYALSRADAKNLCTKIVHKGSWQERALEILP